MQSPTWTTQLQTAHSHQTTWAGKRTKDRKGHGKIGSTEPPRHIPSTAKIHCLATSRVRRQSTGQANGTDQKARHSALRGKRSPRFPYKLGNHSLYYYHIYGIHYCGKRARGRDKKMPISRKQRESLG